MRKELKIYDSGTLGFKKPTIWIAEGNKITKIGTFTNRNTVEKFFQWCKEAGIKINEREWNESGK